MIFFYYRDDLFDELSRKHRRRSMNEDDAELKGFKLVRLAFQGKFEAEIYLEWEASSA